MKRPLNLIMLVLLVGGSTFSTFGQAARSDYRIAPNDIIVIDVFGEKDLSKEFRVSGTGTINYYFLGEVAVAGKTTSEVRDALTADLNRDYLVDPQVTVDVKEYRLREVFVNGQVNKPGAIPLTGEQELNILGALSRAGGFTPRASENKIKFTRPGQGERNFTFNQLKDPHNNIILMPGDIIEVGDKLL
jgi:protein involved in polysaccharide export with SLBB domain